MEEVPGQGAGDLQGANTRSPGAQPAGKEQRALSRLAQMAMVPPERRLAGELAVADREQALRAEKLRRVKAQLVQGTYRVDVRAVAEAIVRREVVRLLSEEKKPKG